jgi:hypothetical protein
MLRTKTHNGRNEIQLFTGRGQPKKLTHIASTSNQAAKPFSALAFRDLIQRRRGAEKTQLKRKAVPPRNLWFRQSKHNANQSIE